MNPISTIKQFILMTIIMSCLPLFAQEQPIRYVIHPQLSADFKKLAYYTREGNHGAAWLYNLDTGENIKLTQHNGYDANPSFSPDGNELAFTTAEGMRTNWNQVKMELATGKITTLVESPEREMHVSWSPDGKYIAFLQFVEGGTNLMVIDSDGNNLRKMDVSDGGKFHPKWAWDSQSITYDLNSNIYQYNLKTKKEQQLTKDGKGREVANVTGHLSPDGKYLVYAKYRKNTKTLHTLEISTGKEKLLNSYSGEESAGGPFFSADGKKIVYHYSKGNQFEIRMMNSDGTGDQLVVK